MHLSSAAQWWDESQLRILVLCSLGLQWFLVLAAPMRKYSIPMWLRRCIQLGSGCSDAVAIYALATVFNRHANGTTAIGCYNGEAADVRKPPSVLEVLWAPVLLVHLGGVEEVSAGNIDDNTLWIRQTVSLLSQVTIALFGFYKSWPGPGAVSGGSGAAGDTRMLACAVLLFILGILSVLEKPLALRGARVDPHTAMSSVMKGARVKPGTWWKWCFTELDDRYKCWKKRPEDDAPILSQGDQVQMILSDLSLYAAEVTLQQARSKKVTLQQKTILEPLNMNMDKTTMKPMLRQAFRIIYTRANIMFTPAYLACHVLLVPSLHIAAIMLFAASRKRGYGATDVKTTYILLCFTAVLDVFGLLISELMYKLMSGTKLPALCENIPGQNLVDSVLRTMRRRPVTGLLLNCARRFGYYYKEVHTSNLYHLVSDFITFQLVRVSDQVKNADLSSYRSFTKTDYWNEEQTKRLLHTDYYLNYLTAGNSNQPPPPTSPPPFNKTIWRSLLKTPFDASVLIWHIATDLCFRSKPPRHFRCRPPHDEVVREVCTEAISNHMAYLLMFRPDMLMTGSRQHLFTEATKKLEHIITQATKDMTEDEKKQPLLDRILLGKMKKKAASLKEEKAYSVIDDACKLADELLGIEDDEDRWYLMHLVWVGMLCYSASMCRGHLHAKSLGEGGEFLSYVWLLISLKGAKTLADKLQMPDKEPGDDYLDDQKPEQDRDKEGSTTRAAPEEYQFKWKHGMFS